MLLVRHIQFELHIYYSLALDIVHTYQQCTKVHFSDVCHGAVVHIDELVFVWSAKVSQTRFGHAGDFLW